MKRIIAAGILLLGVCSQHTCSKMSPERIKAFEVQQLPQAGLNDGLWEFELDLGPETLPFYCEYRNQDSSFTIINATERIVCRPVSFKGDSLFFTTPVFENIFRLKKESPTLITGLWHNTSKGPDYKIPVKAHTSTGKPSVQSQPKSTGEKWEVMFGNKQEGFEKAIGLFNYFERENSSSIVTAMTGTFMTETGDYRFLEGKYHGTDFTLSCFDGGHAFLFKASFDEKHDTIKGMFYSGNHFKQEWKAWRNDQARLRNPDSLTALKPGYTGLAFTLPDLDGKMVQYPGARFNNKVTIVEIMGSWCPNCMDQTRFMEQLKHKYAGKGLEIVALCFERSPDFKKSVAAVSKMTKSLQADYTFLIAGTANKTDAAKVLPMLTCICSYPTTIFIDRKGNVRKIYTGFYGPSTGLYYNQYTEQTESFVQDLLMEK